MNWKWLFILTIAVGCSQVKKNPGDATLRKKQNNFLEDFEKANKLLDGNEYAEAATAYDRLVVSDPTSQLDEIIIFNSGLAHLLNGNCPVAGERFRKIIRSKSDRNFSLIGRSMLKLGDVYTCLGEDNKAIVNLFELYKNRKKFELPAEIAQAEVPAKLAAAYARIGNNKEAAIYFKRAESGLYSLLNSESMPKAQNELLARTLLVMGSMAHIKSSSMSADDYFSTLSALQKYLFKAVEFQQKISSELAANQITKAYEVVWEYIDAVKSDQGEDSAIAERKKVKEQVMIAQSALNGIQSLYSEHLPDPNESELIKNLMTTLKKQELQIRNFIATHLVGTELTPEALAALSLKRPGRVFNPDPVLEIQAQKRKQKKLKK